MKLQPSFYLDDHVVKVARNLLGKYLFTALDGKTCGGMITETEAYRGAADRASHAYGNRRTARTEAMYRNGGVAYVYLCYGIHSLFNVVTAPKGLPHAVLIRGINPTTGLEHMAARLNKKNISGRHTDGPGKLTRALGIHYSHSGTDLSGDEIWIEDRGLEIGDKWVNTGPRIGVEYAGEDAKLPYRFLVQKEFFSNCKIK
ncbi:MAG: DNA-3-methyladenine glycosylase [Bacteroidota bacterium]|nr:DNA-3-methyladenine glycosylase [Bacteroidota bacterium]